MDELKSKFKILATYLAAECDSRDSPELYKALLSTRQVIDSPEYNSELPRFREFLGNGFTKHLIQALSVSNNKSIVNITVSILGDICTVSTFVNSLAVYDILHIISIKLSIFTLEDDIIGSIYRFLGNACQEKVLSNVTVVDNRPIVKHIVCTLKAVADGTSNVTSETTIIMGIRCIREFLSSDTLLVLVTKLEVLKPLVLMLVKYSKTWNQNHEQENILSNIIEALCQYSKFECQLLITELENIKQDNSLLWSDVLLISPKNIVKIIMKLLSMAELPFELPIPELCHGLMELLENGRFMVENEDEEYIYCLCCLLERLANRNTSCSSMNIPLLINTLKHFRKASDSTLRCSFWIMYTLNECKTNKDLINEQLDNGIIEVLPEKLELFLDAVQSLYSEHGSEMTRRFDHLKEDLTIDIHDPLMIPQMPDDTSSNSPQYADEFFNSFCTSSDSLSAMPDDTSSNSPQYVHEVFNSFCTSNDNLSASNHVCYVDDPLLRHHMIPDDTSSDPPQYAHKVFNSFCTSHDNLNAMPDDTSSNSPQYAHEVFNSFCTSNDNQSSSDQVYHPLLRHHKSFWTSNDNLRARSSSGSSSQEITKSKRCDHVYDPVLHHHMMPDDTSSNSPQSALEIMKSFWTSNDNLSASSSSDSSSQEIKSKRCKVEVDYKYLAFLKQKNNLIALLEEVIHAMNNYLKAIPPHPCLASSHLLITLLRCYYFNKSNELLQVMLRIVSTSNYLIPLMLTSFVPKLLGLMKCQDSYDYPKCCERTNIRKDLLSYLTNNAQSAVGAEALAFQLLCANEEVKVKLTFLIPYIINSKSLLIKFLIDCGGLELLLKVCQNDLLKLRSIDGLKILYELAAKKLGIANPKKACRERTYHMTNNTDQLRKQAQVVTFKLDDGSSVLTDRQFLSSKSDYFNTLLNGGFRESGKDEIHLPDIDNETLNILLHHLYNHFDDMLKKTLDTNLDLETLLETVRQCDKFLLKDLCVALINSIVQLKLSPETVSRIYQWSIESGTNLLRAETVTFALVVNIADEQRFTMFNNLFSLGYSEALVDDIQKLIERCLKSEHKRVIVTLQREGGGS